MQSSPAYLERRRFLLQLTGAASGLLAWPGALEAAARRLRAAPARGGFWELVRAQFTIPGDRIYLNVGTLGPQPRIVLDATIEHMRRVAMTLPPGVAWDALKQRLGAFLDCDPAGFVFPRNTTEAMNFVANGLELAPGDEVLTTDHEHIGGLCCWELAAARRGVVLRKVELPRRPATASDIVDAFAAALTPRTRVVSFSHVTFTNGLRLPARELVALARSRGAISVVDGAHPPGMMRVSIRDIDPDFYASSPHKWLMAPQGTGLLWLRGEWRDRLWPTIASGGWNDASLGAHRLNHLGTMDESRLAGLLAAVGFLDAIGGARVEARVHELRRHLEAALAAVPRVRSVTPAEPFATGMVAFTVEGVDSLDLQKRLGERNVRTRVIGEYELGWMRLSPHVYNSTAELERVADMIAEAA